MKLGGVENKNWVRGAGGADSLSSSPWKLPRGNSLEAADGELGWSSGITNSGSG